MAEHLYKCVSRDDLVLHTLDDMMLVYHRTSGITHMLSEPVPEILEAMPESAVSADDVAALLSKKFDLGDTELVQNIVLARLEELCALGLVDRVRTT